MRLPPVLLAIAVGITFAVGASGQTPRAPEAPQVLSKGWLPHAQSLVRQDRAVGVVLREHQMHDTFVADAALAAVPVRETKRGKVTRLMSDDAVRCRTALERPVVPLVLRGKPLAVLFDLVVQEAGASARVPVGVVGGGSPLPRSNERMGQQLEVRVEIGDTLATALDRLVSAGLPFGWGVIQRDETSSSACQIVLFTEDTVWWTPYDALFPAPPLP